MLTEYFTNQKIMDTNTKKMPQEVLILSEALAAHVHDVWMQGRAAAGWTYGPRRDDEQLTHPCMVPYDELPEEEKEFDRQTSLGTLQFILDSGFNITKDQ